MGGIADELLTQAVVHSTNSSSECFLQHKSRMEFYRTELAEASTETAMAVSLTLELKLHAPNDICSDAVLYWIQCHVQL
eukprot:364325-Chlamydomonas_euryale.AAC.7